MLLAVLLTGAILPLATHSLALPSTPTPTPSTCWGQSCDVAAISGSSGEAYNKTTPPKYGTTEGDCCIANYNPAARILESLVPGLEEKCKSYTIVPPPITHEHAPWQQPIQCRPKTFLYARGTSEPGPLGTIGSGIKAALQAAEPNQWHIKDTNYTNDIPGVFCLGLEGGVHAKKILDRIAERCPDTKFVVSGYSQGAMVAREAVGNSTHGDRVLGIVTFGDPFNGAPVKNYNGPIRIYCVPGDLVCYGEPIPLPVHGVYVDNITDASNWILGL